MRAGPRRAAPPAGAVGLPEVGAACEGLNELSRGSLRAGRTRGAEGGRVGSACGVARRLQRPKGVGAGRPALGLEVAEGAAPAGVRVAKL